MAIVYCSCSEKLNFEYYSGPDYIRFKPNNFAGDYTDSYKGVWYFSSRGNTDDTVIYCPVEVLGNLSSRPRQIRLEQTFPNDGYPQATPGLLYVPFDDPASLAAMQIPADTGTFSIPIRIINNRDTLSKYYNGVRLNFKLVDSDDFQAADSAFIHGYIHIYR